MIVNYLNRVMLSVTKHGRGSLSLWQDKMKKSLCRRETDFTQTYVEVKGVNCAYSHKVMTRNQMINAWAR